MANEFDASASMLGYLFQCRIALLDAVRRLRRGDMFSVSLETLDDVVFETVGSPVELLQTKHHIISNCGLGDASSEIWKSFRIWIEGRAAGLIPTDAILYLLTTSCAAHGCAASYLRADGDRNIDKARERLDGVAQSSSSETNAKGYMNYLALEVEARRDLLDRIIVLDKNNNISAMESALKTELGLTVDREFIDPLIVRLEGWWFQRVISHLRRADGGCILSEEVDAELDRLRAQCRSDNLPIDGDLLDIVFDESAFAGHLFVEQLRLIKVANVRVIGAMRQYFRAFEQRSRWLRDGFLVVGELDRYDRRLTEEWEIHFNVMKDDLGDEAAEDALRTAARQLYRWAEAEASVLIRPACCEVFVPRGSLQLLADKAKVGWHADFLNRLQHIVPSSEM